VLDVMLPNLDGFDVLRAARAGSNVAVLMLSARGSTADRISGIASGADDYLPKPFSPAELVVRVKALLRRAEPREEPGRASMSFAQLMVDHGETFEAAQAMFQESVARFFVAALLVAAIASIALAIFIGRRVASPLREVSEAAKLIAQGDHDVRVRPRGPDEIRSLAGSFNRMAAEIEEQERLRREFVSNAAHELRTPLTNLQ